MDERRSRKVKRIITIFTLIVLVPSIYLAVDVIREAAFNTQSQKFVNEIQDSEMLAETEIIKSDREYHHRSQSITLILLGKQLEEAQVLQLQNILHNEYGLKKTNLIIKQSSGKPIDTKQQNELIEDLIDKKDKTIRQQDSIIHELRRQLEENANTD